MRRAVALYAIMSKTLKIGVAGAGVFGGYHANKCAGHPRIDFVGVFDPSETARDAQAVKHIVSAYADFGAMLADCDAVIIASPAIYHGSMALEALSAGCHVLVEKPLAPNEAEAKAAVALAAERGLILQVGHQERFVIRAIGLLNHTERPTAITAERHGPYNTRGRDVSVGLDLMTHDLDLIITLMGGMPQSGEGESIWEKSDHPDKVTGKLYWPHGEATLSASRIEDGYSRKMAITYPSGMVHIDFNAKTLRHDTPLALNESFGNDPSAADSLGAATDAFVASVLDGAPVLVSGQDGLNAVIAAGMIDRSLHENLG